MNLIVPQRRFDNSKPEMMDLPDADAEILRDDLKNLRTINRYFGGLTALQKAVIPIVMKTKPENTVTILDLATGSGDHPVALLGAAQRIGRRIHVTAVDSNTVMLEESRKFAAGLKDIKFERSDIMNMPYKNESFDIVTCSLALHHFSRADVVTLLREMNRISRIGFVVNDLSRSFLGAATTWIYTRLATRNPMTRYDSVISVLRAFTKDELIAMFVEAGIEDVKVYKMRFFRLVAVKEK